jgi:predicted HAD superfamily Cof-like phosphohydrolase
VSVREFHEAFGLPAPDEPTVPDAKTVELRATLICEEVAEVMGALFNMSDRATRGLARTLRSKVSRSAFLYGDPDSGPRMVDLAKELADLRYVTDGCSVELGFDPEAVATIVHHSNMSKLGRHGEVLRRQDGKVLKGPLFQPAEPAIEAMLKDA